MCERMFVCVWSDAGKKRPREEKIPEKQAQRERNERARRAKKRAFEIKSAAHARQSVAGARGNEP